MPIDESFPDTPGPSATTTETPPPNFAQALAQRFDEPMPTFSGDDGGTDPGSYDTEVDPATGVVYGMPADRDATADPATADPAAVVDPANLPAAPAGYRFVKEDEYGELTSAQEKAKQYGDFLQRFDSLGGPEQVARLIAEQEQAHLDGQAQAEQERVASTLARLAEDGRMDTDVAEWLTQQFGPIVAEMARMRPAIQRFQEETAVTRAERDIKSILEKYPTAYPKSVQMEYEKGGLAAAEAEAKAYSAHIANITKATTQREAIANVRANPVDAPRIEGVRRQAPAPSGFRLPKAGTAEAEAYFRRIDGKDE